MRPIFNLDVPFCGCSTESVARVCSTILSGSLNFFWGGGVSVLGFRESYGKLFLDQWMPPAPISNGGFSLDEVDQNWSAVLLNPASSPYGNPTPFSSKGGGKGRVHPGRMS
jgi:hypothetical protein